VALTSTLRDRPYREQRRAREFLTFVVVGGIGYLVDVGVFNLLRYAGEPGLLEHKPLTAKAISVAVATIVTYAGNRHWTWRHRAWSATHREFAIFVLLNVVGMAIALACLALSHYVLGLTGPIADNVSANVVGLAFGTTFRFWAYPRWVFRASTNTASGVEP
jgi:putative flippase GtrA